MAEFYVLRYSPDVPLRKRKHAPTLGRFQTWLEAEDARLERFGADLLEVVRRGEA